MAGSVWNPIPVIPPAEAAALLTAVTAAKDTAVAAANTATAAVAPILAAADLVDDVPALVTSAQTAATNAANSASVASNASATAVNSATSAQTAATAASGSAASAANSSSSASSSASAAVTSANIAEGNSTIAASHAAAASVSATAASNSANSALAYMQSAQTAETNAETAAAAAIITDHTSEECIVLQNTQDLVVSGSRQDLALTYNSNAPAHINRGAGLDTPKVNLLITKGIYTAAAKLTVTNPLGSTINVTLHMRRIDSGANDFSYRFITKAIAAGATETLELPHWTFRQSTQINAIKLAAFTDHASGTLAAAYEIQCYRIGIVP